MARTAVADRQSSPAQAPPLSFLLADVKDMMVLELDRRLHEAGYTDLRAVHGVVFRNLRRDGIRVTDLADAAKMTAQSMGEHVAELEQLGYVVRSPDPQDRRARLISPTAKGVSAMMFAREALRAVEAEWSETLGAGRIRQMRATLESIRKLYRES